MERGWRSVYVLDRDATLPFRLEQLDLASGRRVLIREVAPADRTGVIRCFGAALTDDTKSYAYGYIRYDVATLRRGGRAVSIHPGTRLGPYEVVSPLGADGMSDVDRASTP